jgi:hypothetical protein
MRLPKYDPPVLLLQTVKNNLVLTHNQDDELLLGAIRAAVSYAESYQHRPAGFFLKNAMPPTTEQAVVMLASHWYESRDGSTGGFFGDRPDAAKQAMDSVNMLLKLSRDWKV